MTKKQVIEKRIIKNYMKMGYEFENIYSSCAGNSEEGIYSFGLSFFDKFEGLRYQRAMNETYYSDNKTDFKKWYDSFKDTKREITLVTFKNGSEPECRTLVSAERIDGPVCPKDRTATPVGVWTEQNKEAIWSLILYENERKNSIYASQIPLKNPAICKNGNGFAVACEIESKSGGIVHVFDEKGSQIAEIPGRRPVLAELNNEVFVLVERFVDDAFELSLNSLQDSSVECVIRCENGWYSFNADMAVDSESGEILVAYEISPKWGSSERCGAHRELGIHRIEINGNQIKTVQILEHSLEKLTITEKLRQPVTPVRPKLFAGDGRVLLTYKSFALKSDQKQTGWSLWNCEIKDGIINKPELLSDEMHAMDTNYGIVIEKDQIVCALPCIYQQLDWGPTIRHWLHLYDYDGNIEQPDTSDVILHHYEIPESFARIAKRTERNLTEDGKQLLWCDLHVHSQYSKCQSCDGPPDEKIRYQRDVLGYDVLCLSDHVPGMSGIEYTWTFDMLEREGGHNGLVILGNECNASPGRHTNFYTIKREYFDMFRCAYGSMDHPKRDITYQFIRDEIPDGEMIVIRHTHLDSKRLDANDEDTLSELFDPVLEYTCEAIQTRGNAVMTEFLEPENGYGPFPNHYLDKGYKVGVVGGTDHSNGEGRIRYGITGLWCEKAEISSVWNALKNRKTISCGNAPISLNVACNGVEMGEIVKPSSKLFFSIKANCAYGLKNVSIIKNGKLIAQENLEIDSLEKTITCDSSDKEKAWLLVAVTGSSSYGEDSYALSSPFFIE